jgi:hypothetical protein
MGHYKKITLEIEIAVMKDKDISENQIDGFIKKLKKEMNHALRENRINHGGISIRAIIDEANVKEINKIHVNALGQ